MKKQKNYQEDLTAIRELMERSSKFFSLSGWSGFMAGLYALAGAAFVYARGYSSVFSGNEIRKEDEVSIALTAGVVLLLTLLTAWFLSMRKAQSKGEIFWNPVTKRWLVNLAIPLMAGGLLMLIFVLKNQWEWLPGLALIFYGLSLVNAGKFTYDEIRSLGIIQLILGLAAARYPALGLIFWTIGFGLMHIIYGLYMHLKHEK